MSMKSILLVEDNQSDIELTQRAFAKNHITNELIVAEDGQEAIDYLFGTGPHVGRNLALMPTLILLDLKLPRLDGLGVLKRIRGNARTRRLPVVILTSSNEEHDVAASYDLGVNSFIRKPVDFPQFVQAISTLNLYWLVVNEPPPYDSAENHL